MKNWLKNWEMALSAAALAAIALSFLLPETLRDWPLLAIIAAGGLPLTFNILRQALKGDLGADLLAAIALATAVFLHEYIAAVLIILMLAGGQALEHYATRKASFVLEALASRMPAIAHRKLGQQTVEIAISDIQVGDIIVVFPHEASPVDGTVVEGHGSMDESYLTGEPYRMSKAPGAGVLSGAVNGDSALSIRADRLPQDSRYAKITQVMQEAEQRRPAMRRLGDKLGAVFAPLALAFALGAWWITGDATRFLAVLVIATPCPLLIAIPITIIGAISKAARNGIIIKDPTVLELLPVCRTAIFDKTGTLTYGQPELTEIIPMPGFDKDAVLREAASLERYSKHPLAQAMLEAASAMELPHAGRISEQPGLGLTGLVDGREITITHRRKLDKTAQESLPPSAPGMECVVLEGGQPAALMRFRDTPRAEGRSFIKHLAPAHNFDKIMLVSGDRSSEVEYLGTLLGITEMSAGQTPEQKLAIVREEVARAPTLFMGDGINDAPALTAATVGIAFGNSSSVTSEAAGAVIMESSLAKVDELIHISEAMRSIALQSALGGIALSLVGMGLAAAGYIPPVMGALLQEGIDILAIANALRLTLNSGVNADIKLKPLH